MGRTRAWPLRSLHQEFYFCHFFAHAELPGFRSQPWLQEPATKQNPAPSTDLHRPRGDGGWAKKVKNQNMFWYPAQKKPARAGWPERLGLVRATPWADLAVITDQLWSTITAIFPKRVLGFGFECIYFQVENSIISTPNIDFSYRTIVQSWFASIPSRPHPATYYWIKFLQKNWNKEKACFSCQWEQIQLNFVGLVRQNQRRWASTER